MARLMTAPPPAADTSPFLGRVLGIERHERVAVAWSFAYFFCILSSYYMLRPMREAMGVESGAASIPYLFTTTFVVMMLASPVFGWIASRYPRRRFLPWVYYFFAANILAFYLAFRYAIASDIDFVWIGRVFFVWISVFNLFVVSVFWSFMADLYTREQGRRLFGVISAGGSAGALVGPLATSQLVLPLGFENLLPISATLLLVGVFCIHQLRHWVEAERTDEITKTVASERPLGGSALAGLVAVVRSPYFLAISLSSVVASLLGTALYMFMAELVGRQIEGADARTQLFSYIDGATGILALLFQLLVVKHAVRRIGVGWTLSLMPMVSIAGFALLALNPALIVVAVFQALRRAIGFGFMKPTNDMLYSVVTPEQKYKAKNFVDTAVYRGGDLVGTWSVKAMWALGISGIAVVLVPFALAWSLITLWLGREYRRRDAAGGWDTTGGNK